MFGSLEVNDSCVPLAGMSPGQPGQHRFGKSSLGGGETPTAFGVLVPCTTALLDSVMVPAALAFPYTVALLSVIAPFDDVALPNTEMPLLRLMFPFVHTSPLMTPWPMVAVPCAFTLPPMVVLLASVKFPFV